MRVETGCQTRAPNRMPSTETKQIEIVINGEPHRVPAGATLQEILNFLQVNPEQVAIEKDRAIVRKAEWANTVVQPGAQLEIVRFVGGG
jgi:thiamine biosynthesis protein ThiS